MAIYIGTSGWSYEHWREVLYPPELPKRLWLEHYARHFRTVELNSSYYHWPRTTSFARWYERLPADFLMTVKAPRGLTHARRLLEPEAWVSRMATGLHELREKGALLLVQLPPSMTYDHARLAYFLEQLPPWLRVAVECRHPSWHHDELFQLLESRGAAYCIMSGAALPCILRATAPFVYVRLHGPDSHHLYGGSYSDDDLRWWAARLREWEASGHDVFAYFNNDGHGHAVRNASTLRALVNA